MKYAVVIIDGAADEPLDCFEGRTCLEQANTPFLDSLARDGIVGLAKNVPDGCEPGSNVACMSIMGYDPARYDIGRGAIEGAALGIDLAPGEIAMRVNFCCVEDGRMKSYSSGNISTDDSHALAEQVKARLDDDEFELFKATSFRHILRVRNHPGLMDLVYHTAHDISDQKVLGLEPKAPEGAGAEVREAADAINAWMREASAILADSSVNERRIKENELPANTAWAFWPGVKPEGMEQFSKQYNVNAAMLSPVDLLHGLAGLTGIPCFDAPGMSDGPGNDYASQGEKAVEILGDKDLVFVHIEASDAAGHDGSPEAKVAAIEATDREIVSRLFTLADTCDLRILALPDHPTPCRVKTHTRDMVPFVMGGPGIEAAGGSRLTESEARAGGIVVDPGWKLMGRLLA